MKFEKKAVGSCATMLSVTTEGDEAKLIYEKVQAAYFRNVQIPGFRKGKVPRAMVLQKFGKDIEQDAKQQMVSEFYTKALQESKVEAIALQNVDGISYEDGILKFTATIETDPEFELPKYQKIKVKHGDVTVTDAQVEDRIAQYRKAFARYDDAAEGDVANPGDYVQIDYKGFTGDSARQPLAEIVADEPYVTGKDGHWTQIEDGRFLPEILEALKGMKAGETKEVTVTFDKDATPIDPLKGKKVVYSVTLKAIRHQALPDDELFLKSANEKSMDEMRAKFRTSLENEAQMRETDNCRNQAIDALLEKADFAVPDTFKNRQMQSYLQNLAQRASYTGLGADYFEKNRDEIMKQAEEASVRQVRLSYILKAIIKAENLELTAEELDNGLDTIARGSQGNPSREDVRTRLTESGQLDSFREHLLAEKALDFVAAQSK